MREGEPGLVLAPQGVHARHVADGLGLQPRVADGLPDLARVLEGLESGHEVTDVVEVQPQREVGLAQPPALLRPLEQRDGLAALGDAIGAAEPVAVPGE